MRVEKNGVSGEQVLGSIDYSKGPRKSSTPVIIFADPSKLILGLFIVSNGYINNIGFVQEDSTCRGYGSS
jgi:hypothetical protein